MHDDHEDRLAAEHGALIGALISHKAAAHPVTAGIDAQRRIYEAQEHVKRLHAPPQPGESPEALRERIAARHGLDPALATRLRGETAQELDADAAELARATLPAPDFDAGARELAPGQQPSYEAEHAAFFGALLTGQDPYDR